MRNDILFGAVLPYLIYLVARHFDLSIVHALALGSLCPVVVLVLAYVKAGRLAAFSLVMLAATLTSLIASVWFNSAYLALLKSSLVSGAVGLVFLVSLLLSRPLIFHFASEGDRRKTGSF